MEKNYLYWIWVNELKGVGPVTAKRLLKKFITPEEIYNATKAELKELGEIGEKLSESIVESKDIDKSKKILDECEKQGISITTYEEKKFPSIMDKYSGMPILLYYKGNLYDNISGVAIVGSRRCSDYGKHVTVEAGENSGALITAKYAKEQDKEILAVPNNIYSKESNGTNNLISDGCSIYLNPNQLSINNTVNSTKIDEVKMKNEIINIRDEEKFILDLIKSKSYTIDEIVLALNVDKSTIIEVIFSMELKGIIRCAAGRYFTL